MQVIVLGGTRFIGRAIVEALVAAGHEPIVCHRGDTEPDDLPAVPHLHGDRRDLLDQRSTLAAFGPDALVDCMAMSADDARLAIDAVPDPDLHRVVLSSQDVYRAFATLQHEDLASDALPITEESALRPDRYPYPDVREEYSKIDVEELALRAGATVLRLPMTYGPRDYQRREEWILRRVRGGRPRIPVGPANGIFPLALVDDVANGVVAAIEHPPQGPIVYNLVSAIADPIAVWARRILAAAGSDAELVRVPDGTGLPADLDLTAAMSQSLVVSSEKARRELGYSDTDPDEAVARSVRWHLDHPPEDANEDFSQDDLALAAAG